MHLQLQKCGAQAHAHALLVNAHTRARGTHAGESYAGVFVPLLAEELLARNAKAAEAGRPKPFNLEVRPGHAKGQGRPKGSAGQGLWSSTAGARC